MDDNQLADEIERQSDALLAMPKDRGEAEFQLMKLLVENRQPIMFALRQDSSGGVPVAWMHRDGYNTISVDTRRRQPEWIIEKEWADATPLYAAPQHEPSASAAPEPAAQARINRWIAEGHAQGLEDAARVLVRRAAFSSMHIVSAAFVNAAEEVRSLKIKPRTDETEGK
jgi:hypothetical protein